MGFISFTLQQIQNLYKTFYFWQNFIKSIKLAIKSNTDINAHSSACFTT